MAFLGRSKKVDLQCLAEELGETVMKDMKVVDLKKKILGSTKYEEEFVKELLERIVNEREEEIKRQNELENQHSCPTNFFRCDNGLCIPESGKCDGYPSCSDGSDEFDCESNSEDEFYEYDTDLIEYELVSNGYISSTSKKSQNCNEVSLTVSWVSLKSESISFCPGDDVASRRLLKTFSDTEIKHRAISR
ncbi:unnamed protein product [Larinioides sclopetarius]|uniref:Hemoglobin linker chain n=1 Tax=Larinioides sclopetarius TaxID=280406 RepID=A0AAV2ATZ1_9ARAC